MTRIYLEDESGEPLTDDKGDPKFISTTDGDSKPATDQSVYVDRGGLLGGGTEKLDESYDPSTGELKK